MRPIDSIAVSIKNLDGLVMIELRQLKYFIKVAELEHFGRAAEELHIVQPALSRQVKQLEEEVGANLFERLPRGVRLTAAGKLLLERSRPLVDEIDKLGAAVQLADQGKTGFARVGFADGATYSGVVPSIIREFRKKRPLVELELIPASSASQAELLAKQAIDVGFVYWLPKDMNGIGSIELGHEKVVLAAAESNPLSRHKSVKLKQLSDVPFVWFKRAHAPSFFDLISARCSRSGLVLNVVQDAFTESTMLSLVAADIGVTFITEAAKRRKPDNVVFIEVTDLDATITLRAIWRADDINPAVVEFIKSLRERFSQSMQKRRRVDR
jgi:DNA-binding transcriptional LysR family regulator